ncbi:enolase C-terminal domain-like protein [Limosilactobacillus mucosae]|uniref:enolase C-terminal domain-like protein n=1 Tax=Limosilactobacillus mucosae TaxID=97478 RepID=UPI00233F16A8|nr:enolase C-terminal domain-like protein [Limosilactobacillus mucosae]MDC2839461.1 enolase C-terminal domain-like protein [Limosilactobacillus mucosae]
MSIPTIKKMDVYPVAGYDSMLLNLSGAHEPFFTRNVVILTDSNGTLGVSEVPGGQKITQVLKKSRSDVLGTRLFDYKKVMHIMKEKFSQLDQDGRGQQTFDQRVLIHALTAVETAFLDLIGKFVHEPVAELLGDGQQRTEIPMLGYLFYIGDRTKTNLPYLSSDDDSDDWGKIRREPAMTPEAVVKEAQAAYKRYGFQTFKLKGGVMDGKTEVATIKALHRAFPNAKLDLDPNGAWSLDEAVQYAKELKNDLFYIEDPCGAENGFSGREILAEFQRLTHMPTATNMVDTDWRQMSHSLMLNAISIPLADPHFWTMQGSVAIAKLCQAFKINWGIHSNSHFDISLAMVANVAAAAPGEIYAIDTHWIWQDGQFLTKHPYQIKNGYLHVGKDIEGLGIDVDIKAILKAHALYVDQHLSSRNDALAMQYLIPGWKFDPKKPALVR